MVKIKELRLQNFKAFTNARFVLDDKLTVVIGRNGSGKSTLMDAFDFLNNALTDSLVNALERRGGGMNVAQRTAERNRLVEVAITVILNVDGQSITYGIGMRLDNSLINQNRLRVTEQLTGVDNIPGFFHKGREFKTDLAGIAPVIEPDTLALPLLAGANEMWSKVLDALKRVRCYAIAPTAMRTEPEVGTQTWLEKNGSNAGDVLLNLERRRQKKVVEWLTLYLSKITPRISKISSFATHDGHRRVVFTQERGRVSNENGNGKAETRNQFLASHMSDGTLRAFGILLALQQQPTPSLVFIDEAEDSLHPSAISVILDAIEERSADFQIVISSHNPELLSAYPVITPERVRVVKWQDGESNIYPLSEQVIENTRPPYTVGLLMRENALYTAKTPMKVEGGLFEVAR